MLTPTKLRTMHKLLAKAGDALVELQFLAEEEADKLDTEDAKAREMAACDLLQDVEDGANDADQALDTLHDLLEKLRRYTK